MSGKISDLAHCAGHLINNDILVSFLAPSLREAQNDLDYEKAKDLSQQRAINSYFNEGTRLPPTPPGSTSFLPALTRSAIGWYDQLGSQGGTENSCTSPSGGGTTAGANSTPASNSPTHQEAALSGYQGRADESLLAESYFRSAVASNPSPYFTHMHGYQQQPSGNHLTGKFKHCR